MIRLVIGNSVSRIQGLGPKNFAKIRKALSYKLDSRKKYFGNKLHIDRGYLINKRGDFPSGLLPTVQKMLRNVKHAVVDTRVCPANARDCLTVTKVCQDTKTVTVSHLPTTWFISKDYEPYPEQVEAVNTYADRGIIVAPTAYGKTIMGALLVDKFQVRTLIVVPTLILKTRTIAAYTRWFGVDLVGPGKMIQIENVAALDTNKPANVDLVIIDEFHHSGAKTYRTLNRKAWAGVYFKFGLTATPFRSKSEEQMLLEGVLSEVIYRITYKEAVAKGRILPVEAYYFDVPNTVGVDSNNWRTVYSKLVVNNKDRNRQLCSLIERLKAVQAPFLCLVREIEHGEALNASTGVSFANGQDDQAEILLLEFNLQERIGLIGTVGVMGEGVDSRPCEYVILAGAGKAKTQFMQNVGRAMRLYKDQVSAKVIIPRDKSHKFLIRHFNELVVHLREEYGIKPIKLEIT